MKRTITVDNEAIEAILVALVANRERQEIVSIIADLFAGYSGLTMDVKPAAVTLRPIWVEPSTLRFPIGANVEGRLISEVLEEYLGPQTVEELSTAHREFEAHINRRTKASLMPLSEDIGLRDWSWLDTSKDSYGVAFEGVLAQVPDWYATQVSAALAAGDHPVPKWFWVDFMQRSRAIDREQRQAVLES